MKRVTPGTTGTMTFTIPSASGAYSVKALDQFGKDIKATVAAASTTATVTIPSGNWAGGNPGIGRVEVIQDDGGVKTAVVSERFRIMPGVAESCALSGGYGW